MQHNEVFAVDVGGTFTDFVLRDPVTGAIRVTKSPTTPQSPADGVLRAIGKSGMDLADAGQFFHGTTLGLNTALERKGARVGLITTGGFRDVLEIGRMDWPMYQLHWNQPPPFVPRSLRRDVPERVDAKGEILVELDEDAVRAALDELVSEGAESIAVCFLHAYANPAHERQVGAILAESYPGLSYTLSHELTKEYREWERTMTTAVNASIKPRMAAYFADLEKRTADGGFTGALLVTRCDGGVMSPDEASHNCVRTLISGPASGVMGAAEIARLTGIDNVIACDMGGTSFDAGLVLGGEPTLKPVSEIEELPLLVPVVDLTAIGAGGGSIAWIDDGGALSVGPQSAGAEPGPICYGKGGQDPTFTDAALVTGLLGPANFLAGDFDVDLDGARDGIAKQIAEPLGIGTEDAASGIVELTEAKMAAMLEDITVGRGHDVRDFALLAYGGNGPLVACALASRVGVGKVVIPPSPGTFSAWGMLTLDVVTDVALTRQSELSELTSETLTEIFTQLETSATTSLAEQGVPADHHELNRFLDMRYGSQGHTLQVPLESTQDSPETIRARFEEQHRQTYGFTTPDPVVVVTMRVRSVGRLDRPPMEKLALPERPGMIVPKSVRRAVHRESGGEFAWDVYDRSAIVRGARIAGPAFVEEPTATTVVPPGWGAETDEIGNLIITKESAT